MMSITSPHGDWIMHSKPNPYAELRLFCFPYAGGSSLIYRNWQSNLPATVEICPVQLPGRGNRLLEAPYTSLDSLVRSIARALFPYDDKPFAFFGHSMGALISFELARLLRDEGYRGQPQHLFVSGRRAPHVKKHETPLYNLPDDQFFQELQRLNGTPKGVLEHPELMQFMLPLLRADFSVAENYLYSAAPPLDCPLTVFGGLQDEFANREDLESWAQHTNAPCTVRMFTGDHFFINTAQPLLLRVLGQELQQLVSEHLRAETEAFQQPS